MGFRTFLVIDTFETRRKVVGDSDDEITDVFFKNLMLKWIFPWQSDDIDAIPNNTKTALGLDNVDDGISHEDDMTGQQRSNLHGKPIMITAEPISGDEHIIVYSLDPTLEEDSDFLTMPLNPDVNDNGNNKIHKLDGGVLADASSGLNWTILKDDGTATFNPDSPKPKPQCKICVQFLPPESQHPFDGAPPFPENATFRMQPFMLFRRKHIA